MIPELEDFYKAHSKWTGNHKGVDWEICWWGRSDYMPSGTWNYYLYIKEETFADKELFNALWLEQETHKYTTSDRIYKSYPYDKSPLNSLDFHGGITFWEQNTNSQDCRFIKVGCDYAHYWDKERGYPDTFQSVKMDVENTCKQFSKLYPLLLRCSWDGTYHPQNEMMKWGDGYLWQGNVEKRNESFSANPITFIQGDWEE